MNLVYSVVRPIEGIPRYDATCEEVPFHHMACTPVLDPVPVVGWSMGVVPDQVGNRDKMGKPNKGGALDWLLILGVKCRSAMMESLAFAAHPDQHRIAVAIAVAFHHLLLLRSLDRCIRVANSEHVG